jgi:hypothetical protein
MCTLRNKVFPENPYRFFTLCTLYRTPKGFLENPERGFYNSPKTLFGFPETRFGFFTLCEEPSWVF